MPRVSVVIPTHNRRGLLERALRSVDGQGFRDFEVVVVNDGFGGRHGGVAPRESTECEPG